MLRAGAAVGGALGVPGGALAAGGRPSAAVTPSAALPQPPELPSGLEAYRTPHVNRAGEVTHHGLWACAPRDGQDLADLANWAHGNGWRLRARGKAPPWSPLAITGPTESDRHVLLIDTTRHLTRMELVAPPAGLPGPSARRPG
ncbi:hypothetical protein [Streptomyces sp. NPDC049944]|uniref:hypothetical protein n=1 Tax=Streptomyces sp. NPDC049944 TaxID=3155657 RepID=UPI00344841E1